MKMTWRCTQALLKILECLLKLSPVLRDVAEDMECVGLLRLGAQDIPADGGCPVRLPGLV